MLPGKLLEMEAWEWEGFVAYATVEPFGPVRDDLRAAEVVCATANVWGAGLKPGDVFATLRDPPKSRAPRPSEKPLPGGAARFAALCPALTPVESR